MLCIYVCIKILVIYFITNVQHILHAQLCIWWSLHVSSSHTINLFSQHLLLCYKSYISLNLHARLCTVIHFSYIIYVWVNLKGKYSQNFKMECVTLQHIECCAIAVVKPMDLEYIPHKILDHSWQVPQGILLMFAIALMWKHLYAVLSKLWKIVICMKDVVITCAVITFY